jgi:hypothetical protein
VKYEKFADKIGKIGIILKSFDGQNVKELILINFLRLRDIICRCFCEHRYFCNIIVRVASRFFLPLLKIKEEAKKEKSL